MAASWGFSRHDGYTFHHGIKIENGKMHPHREDERNVELAEKLGFTIDRSTQHDNGISFIKGRIRIWQFIRGWQVADIYPHNDDPKGCDYYQNHRPVGGLAYALLREVYRA